MAEERPGRSGEARPPRAPHFSPWDPCGKRPHRQTLGCELSMWPGAARLRKRRHSGLPCRSALRRGAGGLHLNSEKPAPAARQERPRPRRPPAWAHLALRDLGRAQWLGEGRERGDRNIPPCLPVFWGLSATSSVLLVNSFPVLVPVNQRALWSNTAAFVTFLCIHNIEALKQA